MNELGTFLRARRGGLTPREVGLVDTAGPRRVSGLRREEVAQLASISTDYYTRLEQGRIRASAPVLTALADALQLDGDERAYLFSLAEKHPAPAPRRGTQKVQPQLRRVLDDLTTIPAIVMGRRMDILGWNRLAAAMMVDYSQIPVAERNYIRLLFTHPNMLSLYEDWDSVAITAVSQLRMEAARYPDDPRLAKLVGELSMQNPKFSTWWAARSVATLSTGRKTLIHPEVGELVLDWDTLIKADDAEQQLVVWTAEPGTPSHDAMLRLVKLADKLTVD